MRRGRFVSLVLSCLLMAAGWTYATNPPSVAYGALDATTTLLATGFNGQGELGTGDTDNRSTPSPVSVSALSTRDFVSVTAGGSQSCALTATGIPYCWGRNGDGQLGNGNTTQQNPPTPVSISALPAGTTFSAITAGDAHTCAVTASGIPYCWGSGLNGRLGTGNETSRTSPSPVSTSALLAGVRFSTITAGFAHTCALTTAGVAYCWGSTNQGQIGSGNAIQQMSPTPVSISALPSGTAFSTLTAAKGHTCALTTAGVPYCWGDNSLGALGSGAVVVDRLSPVAVSISALPTGTMFSAIDTGELHTCALTTTGTPYCWGGESDGQLGDGEPPPEYDDQVDPPLTQPSPVAVNIAAGTRVITRTLELGLSGTIG